MPVPCSLCANPRRGEIDAAIHAGQAQRAIARTFGLTKDLVNRHARGCCKVSATTKAAADAARKRSKRVLERKLTEIVKKSVSLASPAAVLQLHEQRYAEVDAIFQEARAVNDHRLALAADKARGEIAGDAARLQGFEKTASPLVEVHVQLIQQKLAALSDDELDAVIRGGSVPMLEAAGSEIIEGSAE
jgi:hypothetical protein